LKKASTLWSELTRRNVFRVGIGFLASAWLVIQVADTVLSNFEAPTWIVQALIAAAGIGFPIVLAIAWFYELTPAGVQAEDELEPEHQARYSRRLVDLVIIGTLVLAVSFLLARDIFGDRMGVSDALSIAVLPGVDRSPESDEEYFSDGMAEELINLLAKIPDLRVISRSSSFSFKGSNLGVPAIAEQLNVNHVLEGSVRSLDGQVRIQAQLIDARNDSLMWSKTYDRSLDSIFVLQKEIATDILRELQVDLLGEIPLIAEVDPEAHALYLRALHIMNERLEPSYALAIAGLKEALIIEPDYVAAMLLIGRLHHSEGSRGHRPLEEGVRLAREWVDRALEVEPENAEAIAWIGFLARRYDDDYVSAAYHAERALALDPTNASLIGDMASMVGTFASLEESIVMGEYAVTHDPMCDNCYLILARSYRDAGRLDDAEATLRTDRALRPQKPLGHNLGQILLLKGDAEGALADFQNMRDRDPDKQFSLAAALHDLGRLEEFGEILTSVEESGIAPIALAELYAYIGDSDAAFDKLFQTLPELPRKPTSISRDAMFRNLHDDPRWQDVLRQLGVHPDQLEALDFNVTLPN
jgi:TolB-like protein